MFRLVSQQIVPTDAIIAGFLSDLNVTHMMHVILYACLLFFFLFFYFLKVIFNCVFCCIYSCYHLWCIKAY